jgi:serine/threonine-protein kinase
VARRGDGSPCVKVLDFGVSKMRSPPNTMKMNITRTTEIFGSPSYMSPEQINAPREVDERSDVWALGVILYECLTGVLPFTGEIVPEIFMRVSMHDPDRPRALRADLPEELDALVMRCLEKDPAARIPSVADLAEGLLPFVPARTRNGVVVVRSSKPPKGDLETAQTLSASSGRIIVRTPRSSSPELQARTPPAPAQREEQESTVHVPKKPIPAGAIAAIAIVLFGVVGFLLLRGRGEAPSVSPAQQTTVTVAPLARTPESIPPRVDPAPEPAPAPSAVPVPVGVLPRSRPTAPPRISAPPPPSATSAPNAVTAPNAMTASTVAPAAAPDAGDYNEFGRRK